MKLKLILKSFSSYHVNVVTTKILELTQQKQIKIQGPIFIPPRKILINILKSPHINKDARDQIGMEKHKILFLIKQIDKTQLKQLLKININPIVKVLLQLTT
ncbi:hypothetical protein JSR02_00060 [Candidatus Vidania fulgoroideae]|uniref:Small ribosomal subunit protein uS10 n=1 Tax=Candidatus Vidania fulgoroideorum TaxID=881286 RepID=A0A975ADR8_9PROT|nr:hypothetical protein JSR02_00060 [Candidatus Vidania fulgoroideae]